MPQYETTSGSEEIKPIAISIVELMYLYALMKAETS